MCKTTTVTTPRTDDSRRVAVGMAMMLLSGVLFAIMSALARVAEDRGLPSMQVVLVSGFVRWLGISSVLVRSRESPLGPPGSPPSLRVLLVVRSLSGMTAFSCATFAFGVMPLGDATSIFLTSPVWAALLGRVFLGERLHVLDVLSIGVALGGVLLVARPTALFGSEDADDLTAAAAAAAAATADSTASFLGPYVVLAGAGFAGAVPVLVRTIRRRGKVHPAVIAHAYAFVTICVSPLGLLLPGQSPRLTSGVAEPLVTWLACVGVGVLAVPNQLLVNAGLMRTPAALGSMMRLIDVPSAYALQVLLFGELPRASSMLGASIIVLCTAGSAVRKWREGRASGESATAAATVAAASDSAVAATEALTTSTSSQQPQDEGGAPDDAWVELNDAAKKARAAGDG